jgi:hypothetical protein
MSEELEQNNDGTLSGLKKTIIGVATTAIMGLGTWGVTQLTGGDDEPAPVQQAAPVINITNSNQQSQQATGGGKTVIIKEKETVKEAAPVVKPKKKEGDEFKEEAPKW